jgi:uncharacterized membrane protein YphA (DoxX/SURF4 family)
VQKNLSLILRYLFGLMMTVVGVLKIVKPGFKVPDDATLQSLVDSGWLWPLIGAAETLGGLALLVRRFVPIGLAVLAPIVAGIAAYSVKTGGEESIVGIVLLAGFLYLAWQKRHHFSSLWTADQPA